MPNIGFWATAGGAGGAAGAYELIESQILGATTSSVSFVAIPSTYKHLEIRYTGRSANTASGLTLTFNGITTGYSHHYLQGQATQPTAAYGTNQPSIAFAYAIAHSGSDAGSHGAGIISVLDYASTQKNKTVRAFGGYQSNSSTITLNSGLFISTAAITSFTLNSSGGFVSGSRFSLYGIKG